MDVFQVRNWGLDGMDGQQDGEVGEIQDGGVQIRKKLEDVRKFNKMRINEAAISDSGVKTFKCSLGIGKILMHAIKK